MPLQDMTASDALALMKQNIGAPIRLAQKYMTHDAGSQWRVKSVNMLGGTCVIAVSPLDGAGKGFFAPYKTFDIDLDTATPAPVVEPPTVVEAAKADIAGPRNEFSMDGFEAGDPVYEAFAAVAPDTDTARELFMTYISEHSEYDTEPLDDLLRKANVRPGTWWTDTNVTSMLMLLNETQDSAFDVESPEEAPGVDEPQQDDGVVEGPVVEVPKAKPAIFIHPDVKPSLSGPEPAAPKKRGRPPKNKVEDKVLVTAPPQPAVRTVPAAVLTAALDNVPVPTEIREVFPVVQAGPIAVPSPLGIELACRILPEVASDDNPEFLLEQVIGVIRRSLLLDEE